MPPLKTIEYLRVTRSHRCPICGKADYCGYSADGEVAICMRRESPHQARNGGWVHRLTDRPLPKPSRAGPPVPSSGPPGLDARTLWEALRAATGPTHVQAHAKALGVSGVSLDALGAAWATQYRAWAFPMRDGDGEIIGIRLRAEDGKKWAVRGSRAGLIYDPCLCGAGPMLICEGPTDAAAAMTLGFPAAGRPSCLGQEDMVKRLCRRLCEPPLIVADRDGPGLRGAMRLAEKIRIPCRMVIPPAKDLREWLRCGATANDVMTLAGNAVWLNVR